jgi:serine/threonine protein kinase
MTGLVTTSKANPPPPSKSSLVGRKLGRYEVLARLAAGGMAEVHVARAHGVAGFERLVAIKILHANLAHEEQFIEMFLDEARLAARIRHPNVVATLDISGTEETGYFLVMEYIEGEHIGHILSTAVKLNERIPVPVTLRIIMDALSGLGAAHGLTDENGTVLNLVHRDVSPHNILVGVDGVARLTDFGVAKAEVRLSHTREGQIKGKLAYMAPEQASANQTDARSDLFSIGIIFWETLTGSRLFRADTTAAVLNKLLSEEIPTPSSVDETLKPFDEVALKALDRDPDKRFQNADEFIDALEAVAAKSGVGVARRRDVGKIVEKYAAEKLNRDKERVREAIRAIGQSPIDAPRSGSFREEITGSSSHSPDGTFPNARYIPSISAVSKIGTNFVSKQTDPNINQVLRQNGLQAELVRLGEAEEQELSGADLEPAEMSRSMLSAVDAMSASHRGMRLLVWFAAACLVVALIATGSLICQRQQQPSVWIRGVAPTAPAKTAQKPAPVLDTIAPVVPPVTAPEVTPEDTSNSPPKIGSEAAQAPVKAASKPHAENRGASRRSEERNTKGSSEKPRKVPVKPQTQPVDLPPPNPYLNSQ